MPIRTTIFSSRNSSETFSELNRLEGLYLATVRRKLGLDLFFSDGTHGVYSVVAYSEGDKTEEIQWLKSNVKETRT